MDYYRNVDYTEYPKYSHYRLIGIRYLFTDETSYVEPVTLEEMKQYGYIDFATDDTLLGTHFIKSARQQSEKYLQKSLGIRTVRFTALECPDKQKLMWGPIAPDQDLFNGDILIDGGFDIDVSYTTDASLVNEDIKGAIMSQAFYLYQNRDRFRQDSSIVNIHDSFKEKLNPYRNISWF